MHLRHGRYLREGKVVAVPQKVEDWEDGLVDENSELLVVELIAPGGGWLEDPEVNFVRVQTGETTAKLVPIEDLRELVRSRVQIFSRPSASLRKLNTPCRLKQAPLHTIALVSLSDLETTLASSHDA